MARLPSRLRGREGERAGACVERAGGGTRAVRHWRRSVCRRSRWSKLSLPKRRTSASAPRRALQFVRMLAAGEGRRHVQAFVDAYAFDAPKATLDPAGAVVGDCY